MALLSIYPIIHREKKRIALEIDRYMKGSDYDLITRNLPERLYSITTERHTHIVSDALLSVGSPFDRMVSETGFITNRNRRPP